MKITEPDPNSPTWPIVLQFAKLMEHKLSLNRHKGDREGWLKDNIDALFTRIEDETGELDDVMSEEERGEASKLDVALEAADVANFAMMVADSATNGALLNPGNTEVQACKAMGVTKS